MQKPNHKLPCKKNANATKDLAYSKRELEIDCSAADQSPSMMISDSCDEDAMSDPSIKVVGMSF